MTVTTEYLVDPLPFVVLTDGPAPESWSHADGVITATAPPRTDLFIDPAGVHPMSDAPRLLGTPEGDFQFSARVTVDFAATFDAGVLAVFVDQQNWAKLCFEYTPQGNPSVVTVVTRGESDDANAFELSENTVWLRISRTGTTFAFHASTDGTWWRLVRYFALNRQSEFDGQPKPSQPEIGRPELDGRPKPSQAHGGVTRVGFLAQSPTGEGCRITFDQINYRPEAPADMRDGS